MLADGATRLTTTRVAARAGVSVGTMYQYYPDKQALLFAILKRQLEAVENALLAVAKELAGCSLNTIASGLSHAWLDAKTADIEASKAIYGIAAEFDITELMAEGSRRMQHALRKLLATASDRHITDHEAAAFMVMAILGGATRAVMELGASKRDIACLRQELPHACYGYILAVSEASNLVPLDNHSA